ncbi:MAG: 50S ribosomal protein L21 [Caldilineaceae bacterium]|nr:50S ribosomal protein L21 [Caldilineaceae bacterium]
MQAVIRTGGKQYYVTAGDILEVEKLAGEIGDTITLDDVLMVANEDDVTVGQPTVADAAVTATITGQYRGNKIQVFRYRPKKRIRVRKGHRQYITRLAIESIRLGDQEYTTPVVEEPEFVTPEPVIETPELVEETPDVGAPEVVEAGEPVDVESAVPIGEGLTAERQETEDNTSSEAASDEADTDADRNK